MTDEERHTWAGLVGRITGQLPPAFLSLLAINVAFLGLLFWFLDTLILGRMALVEKLIDACADNRR